MLTPDKPPPEDYYQNNCRVLLQFVRDQYASYEFAREFQILQVADSYLQASDDAQRLFARLLTRKGPLFRADKLQYAEVTDLSAALQELQSCGLIAIQPRVAAELVLKLLPKAEILTLWQLPAAAKNLRKPELIATLVARYSDAALLGQLGAHILWLHIQHPEVWALVRLLYFGERMQDWSAFVLRDLGLVRYHDMPLIKPRINSSKALRRELHYRRLSELSYRLGESGALAEPLADELADELVTQLRSNCSDRFLQRRRNKTLLRIAQWQQQQGASQAALGSYALVTLHPARERRVRLLKKMQRDEECSQLLAAIAAQPSCEEELHFVQRLGKRRAGYQPPTTVVKVERVETQVENQALLLLTRQGGWGAHVENSLLCSLTGLLYWQIIFLPIPGAFTNPFQSGPNDLYFADFVAARAQQIANLEAALADDAQLRTHLAAVVQEKFGQANRLVNWKLLMQLDIEAVLAVMPAADIRKLCAFLIRNLDRRRAGLPDLFVAYADGSYELVEVKGPNDQLQPGQRVWFEHLARLEIPARVLQIQLQKQSEPGHG